MEFNRPYKITLWEDETSYVVQRESQRLIVTDPQPSDTVLNVFNNENCIAIIGSDTMDTPIRAYDPKLTMEINGKKTLTFSIAYRYWDYEEKDFKLNPFINLLVNERRIKLWYDDDWHEFVIKQKEESSEKYVFSYTCEDIYLTELGRNGYEVELNTDLQNNMGTAIQLGERILAESDWEIAPIGNGENDSDSIIQTEKEGLYLYTLPCNSDEGIEAICMQDFEYNGITVNQGDSKFISGGSTIYIFYSTFVNKENPVQFFYVDENDEYRYAQNNYYAIDDHGFIINSPNWSLTLPCNNAGTTTPLFSSLANFYGVSEASLEDPDTLQLSMSSYFGKKVFNMQESVYIPEIDEICTSYMKNGVKYYCYKKIEYASIAETQNILVNTEGFLDTNGWGSYSSTLNAYLPTTGGLNGQMCLQMDLTPGWVAYESFEDAQAAHTAGKRVYYLEDEKYILLSCTATLISGTTYYKNETCYNTGFFNNRELLREMVASTEDTYVLMLLMDSADDPTLSAVSAEVYAERVTSDGTANELLMQFTGPGTIDQDGYLTLYGKIKKTISYTSLVDTYTNITFYLYGNGIYSTAKALCFKKIVGANGQIIIPDLEYIDNSIDRDKYYFFTAAQINNTISSTDDLLYAAIQYNENGFTPYYPYAMEKVTTIEGEKSNYFNLIQTICEKFECWAKFIVEHDDNGAIVTYYTHTSDTERKPGKTYYSYIGDSQPSGNAFYEHIRWQIDTTSTMSDLYERKASKKIAFKEYIGKDNPVGFRYGINLRSIVRNVASDQITTKLIVEQNSNEFAKDKSCSIQKSVLNPSGENMIFNFQYFINHKLIDEVELNKDLYGSSDKSGIALLPNLHNLNKILEGIVQELINLEFTLDDIGNNLLILDNQDKEGEEAMSKLIQDIEATGYSDFTPEILEKFEYLRGLVTEQQYYNAVLTAYSDIVSNLHSLQDAYETKKETLITQRDSYETQKRALVKEFYKKYSKYIREGTWISEDYYDEDLYYLDAQMVLYTSAFPQIKYTINVVEISEIEEYEPYVFSIGDKTYMEDTEFFGWDSKGRPYKEDIVISKVMYHLDDPSQNTIEVQNYKTQFEDLFQRIAAETQSLQYHSGEYKRAADAIGQDYIIDGTLMQNSLKNNELVIQNAHNQAVFWDDSGISISNSRNPNEIVRLTSNGIVLTKDGGFNWETGITANGINADVITAGRLDTNMIRIFNGERQTFQWNSTGINAYAQNASTQQVDYNTFVRFDQYGLYGLTADADWNPDTPTGNPSLSGLAKVKRDAYFSLTWDGLKIKLPNSGVNNEVINVNDKFIVYGDGSIKATNGEFTGTVYATDGTFSGTLSAAKVSGALTAAAGGGSIRGIELSIGGTEQSPNFYVDSSGNLTAKGNIDLSDGNLTLGSGSIQLGDLSNDVTSQFGDENPSYLHSTYISRTEIRSPILASGELTNLSKGAYVTIGGFGSDAQYGDLVLYRRVPNSSSKTEVFRIVDWVDKVVLCAFNTDTSGDAYSGAFLVTDGDYTDAYGTWNFHGTVTGLSATAVFG